MTTIGNNPGHMLRHQSRLQAVTVLQYDTQSDCYAGLGFSGQHKLCGKKAWLADVSSQSLSCLSFIGDLCTV